jgi:hypothetical protein
MQVNGLCKESAFSQASVFALSMAGTRVPLPSLAPLQVFCQVPK